MLGDNNYYTPKPEEFHVGFEFQYKKPNGDWVNQLQTPSSVNYRIGNDELSWAEVAFIIPTKLRVAYLDGDAIMDFKFEIANDEGNTYKSLKKLRGLSAGDDRTLFVQHEVYKTPEGSTRVNTHIWWRENRGAEITIFEGSILNKGEFRKILKQIHADTIT
jgi:hypothetical protein